MKKNNFLELMRIGFARSIQENTIDPIKKEVEALEADPYGMVSKQDVLEIIERFSLVEDNE